VETCQLVGDVRTLEGWLKVKQDDGGQQRRYCVLYGGAEPALCVYEDMVGGKQGGSLLIGEGLRLRVVDIGNVESVDTGRSVGLIVWYVPTQQDEGEQQKTRTGRDGGKARRQRQRRGQQQDLMEALHMVATSRRDRDQWVGVLRAALLEGVSAAQRLMEV
jgi:hypothetical protein